MQQKYNKNNNKVEKHENKIFIHRCYDDVVPDKQ